MSVLIETTERYFNCIFMVFALIDIINTTESLFSIWKLKNEIQYVIANLLIIVRSLNDEVFVSCQE